MLGSKFKGSGFKGLKFRSCSVSTTPVKCSRGAQVGFTFNWAGGKAKEYFRKGKRNGFDFYKKLLDRMNQPSLKSFGTAHRIFMIFLLSPSARFSSRSVFNS
jgi:hypothetical protein